jgi:hypothetical protein
VRKRQPLGGSIGDGTSPLIAAWDLLRGDSGSGLGIEASSATV